MSVITPPGTAPTYPAEWDPVLLEDDGRDEGHLVPKEGVTALGAPGEEPWSEKDGHQFKDQSGGWARTALSGQLFSPVRAQSRVPAEPSVSITWTIIHP